MALPIHQLPIGGGFDPSGDPNTLFYIDRRVLDRVRDVGPEWKYEDARFILEAIRDPDAVFENLKRHGLDEAVCYSVRPVRDPDEPDAPFQPRFGFVFLTFLVPCIGGYMAFDWEWREEDPDEPGHPLGWSADFARRIWSRT